MSGSAITGMGGKRGGLWFITRIAGSVGVLQYFNEVGIRVPKDTAIISINNSEVAKYISPPLTSYNIDQTALSKLAISVLLMRITNSDLPKVHVTMNTNLIIRKSFN